MRCLNRVMVIGYVGRDPEMRYTSSGRAVTSFSVGATRKWTSSEGETREETEWFNVVAWGDLAEICKQYVSKGQPVYVEGRLQTRGWDDQEGKKRYRTELVAQEVIMLSHRSDSDGGRHRSDSDGGREYDVEPEQAASDGEDEFPF
jgi:single-strand DNA-binding protein